jgi:flagellar hook-associated protein 1 FlgK
MSLNGALNIGRTGITAAQTALQVTGNNMANAATVGYHRRSIHLTPLTGERVGNNQFAGRGVSLQSIRREVDVALQGRHRDAVSHEHAALVDQQFLGMLETIQNELTGNDLSTLLTNFFSTFSELANNPEDVGVRSVVIEEGRSIAGRIEAIRRDYDVARDDIDKALGSAVNRANELLDQIEDITRQITLTEAGVGDENSLRDHRDLLVDELAQFIDVTANEQPSGTLDLFVGSIPVMLAGQSRGIELRVEPAGSSEDVTVRVAVDGTTLDVQSGQIGGLLAARGNTIEPAIASLDSLARNLIFEVNRIHSQGQGQQGFEFVEGTYDLNDTTVPLNSAAADLPFRVENGSFFLHVTHSDSGLRTTHQVNIDGDTMSLDDLVDEINVVLGVPNATAGVGTANRLTLTAAAGFEISFSDDSSGALAALGVNTYFVGEDSTAIDVNDVLLDDSRYLATRADHVPGSNGSVLSMVDLQEQGLDDLNGATLRGFWQDQVASLATRTQTANETVAASQLVRESLSAQNLAVSGVSLDDEAVNLLTYQRQFQAAARFISVVDESLQVLLSIV